MRLLPLALGLGLAVTLGACSSGGRSDATATTSAATGATSGTSGTDAAATVGGYLGTLKLSVTDQEAACMADGISPATVGALAEATGHDAKLSDEASQELFGALVRCEPATYVRAQVEAITKNTKASTEEAQCVVHAANGLIGRDAAVLAVASREGSIGQWPDAERGQLREAIASCVPADLVDKILAG